MEGATSIFQTSLGTQKMDQGGMEPFRTTRYPISYGPLPRVLPLENGEGFQIAKEDKGNDKPKQKRKRKVTKKDKKQDSKNKKKKKKESTNNDKAPSNAEKGGTRKRHLKKSSEKTVDSGVGVASGSRTQKRRKLETTSTTRDLSSEGRNASGDATLPAYSALDIPEGGRTFPSSPNKRKDNLFMWPESEIQYINSFLDTETASGLLGALSKEWQQGETSLNGNSISEALNDERAVDYRGIDSNVVWFGDSQTELTLGGKPRTHRPWAQCPLLLEVKQKLEAELSCSFNSVMCAHYKDGSYFTNFGSDDDEVLGPAPGIAMLALGSKRTIVLRPKQPHPLMQRIRVAMQGACILYMHGKIQSYYQYAMPPDGVSSSSAQILLTFRYIYDKQNVPKVSSGQLQSSFYSTPSPRSPSNHPDTGNPAETSTTEPPIMIKAVRQEAPTRLQTSMITVKPEKMADPFLEYVGKIFQSKSELDARGIHKYDSGNIDGTISGGVQSVILWDETVPQVEKDIHFPRTSSPSSTEMQCKLEKMMLKKNIECTLPLRVIRGWGNPQIQAVYRYDGVYDVKNSPIKKKKKQQGKDNDQPIKPEFVFRRRNIYSSLEDLAGGTKKRGRRKKIVQPQQQSKLLPSLSPLPSAAPRTLASIRPKPSPGGHDLQQQLLPNTVQNPAAQHILQLTLNMNALASLKKLSPAVPVTMPFISNNSGTPASVPSTITQLSVSNSNAATTTLPLQPPSQGAQFIPSPASSLSTVLPNIAANAAPPTGNITGNGSLVSTQQLFGQSLNHLPGLQIPQLSSPTSQPSPLLKKEIQQQQEHILRQQIALLRQHEQQLPHQQQLQKVQHDPRKQGAALRQPASVIYPQQPLTPQPTNRPIQPKGPLPNSKPGPGANPAILEGNPFVLLFPNQTYLQPHLYDLPMSLLLPYIKWIPHKHVEAVRAMELRKLQEMTRARIPEEKVEALPSKDIGMERAKETVTGEQGQETLEEEKARKQRRRLSDLMEANAKVFKRTHINSLLPPLASAPSISPETNTRKSKRNPKPPKKMIPYEEKIFLDKPKRKKDIKKEKLRGSHEEGMLFCLCRSPEEYGFMICCDDCNEWYHSGCIGMNEEEGRLLEVYVCPQCAPQPEKQEDPMPLLVKTEVKEENWEAEVQWLELGEWISLEEGGMDMDGDDRGIAADEGGLVFICYASYDDIKAEKAAAQKLRSIWPKKEEEL